MAAPRRYPLAPGLQASGDEAALITSFPTTEVRLTSRPMVFIRTSEAVHSFQKGGRETAGNQNDLKERGRRVAGGRPLKLCVTRPGSWIIITCLGHTFGLWLTAVSRGRRTTQRWQYWALVAMTRDTVIRDTSNLVHYHTLSKRGFTTGLT